MMLAVKQTFDTLTTLGFSSTSQSTCCVRAAVQSDSDTRAHLETVENWPMIAFSLSLESVINQMWIPTVSGPIDATMSN